MARNRKRAKDRRPARPPEGAAAVPRARPSLATARQNGDPGPGDPREELPTPLEHATPDAELVDAQLAVGAAEASRLDAGALAGAPGEDLIGEDPTGEDQTGEDQTGEDRTGEDRTGEEEEEAAHLPQRAPAASLSLPARTVAFLQGSWRELQRVQWPDRRQVMQATGVVIGFVVVAGVFLGVSDYVAQRIVNLILK